MQFTPSPLTVGNPPASGYTLDRMAGRAHLDDDRRESMGRELSKERKRTAAGDGPPGPVICGVEEESRCRSAALMAARLARGLSRPLLLVHVARPPDELPAGMAQQREIMRDQVTKAGRRLLGEVGAYLVRAPGISPALEEAEARVDFGDPASRLREVAEDLDASLIVVGTRGRGPTKAAVLGSVSQTLAVEQSRPVLVVPPEEGDPPARTSLDLGSSIVCGVDGSGHAAAAARVAGWLASSLGCRLILAHASSDGEAPERIIAYDDLLDPETRPRLALLRRAANIAAADEVELALIGGNCASTLEELAERESAGLIAVGSRGHGPFESLVLGSVSRSLLGSGRLPVLVVND